MVSLLINIHAFSTVVAVKLIRMPGVILLMNGHAIQATCKRTDRGGTLVKSYEDTCGIFD